MNTTIPSLWKDVFSRQSEKMKWFNNDYSNDLQEMVKDKTGKSLYILNDVLSGNDVSTYIWDSFFKNYSYGEYPILEAYFNVNSGLRPEINGDFYNFEIYFETSSGNHNTSTSNVFANRVLDKENNNINETTSFTYKEKSIALPIYFAAPFKDIDETKLASDTDNEVKVYKAKFKTSAEFNSNLFVKCETKDVIYLHLVSPAGLYFLKEIIQDFTGITNEGWDSFFNEKTTRNLARRILAQRGKSLETLQSIVNDATEVMVKARTELMKAQRLQKAGSNPVEITKQLMVQLQEVAIKEPLIKIVGVDSEGRFNVGISGLELKYYPGQDHCTCSGDDEDDDESYCHYCEYGSGYLPQEEYRKESGEIKKVMIPDFIVNLDTQRVLGVNESIQHPHIFGGDNRVCLGNSSTIYAQVLGSLDIVGTTRIFLSLLDRYNPDSPAHSSINCPEEFMKYNKVKKFNMSDFEMAFINNGIETIYIRKEEVKEIKAKKKEGETK